MYTLSKSLATDLYQSRHTAPVGDGSLRSQLSFKPMTYSTLLYLSLHYLVVPGGKQVNGRTKPMTTLDCEPFDFLKTSVNLSQAWWSCL